MILTTANSISNYYYYYYHINPPVLFHVVQELFCEGQIIFKQLVGEQHIIRKNDELLKSLDTALSKFPDNFYLLSVSCAIEVSCVSVCYYETVIFHYYYYTYRVNYQIGVLECRVERRLDYGLPFRYAYQADVV